MLLMTFYINKFFIDPGRPRICISLVTILCYRHEKKKGKDLLNSKFSEYLHEITRDLKRIAFCLSE